MRKWSKFLQFKIKSKIIRSGKASRNRRMRSQSNGGHLDLKLPLEKITLLKVIIRIVPSLMLISLMILVRG